MSQDKHSCDDNHERRPFVGSASLAVERAASMLRAMGDTARLRLLERLAAEELCVSEIAAASDEGLSTISQRLKTLRAEGLVTRRRDGKHIYYKLADEHVAELIRTVLEHAVEPHLHTKEPKP